MHRWGFAFDGQNAENIDYRMDCVLTMPRHADIKTHQVGDLCFQELRFGEIMMLLTRFDLRLTLLSAGLAMSLAGCGAARNPWDRVYPAAGKVTLNGKPISGAQVTLTPVDAEVPAKIRPTAVTHADGHFELGTLDTADGAPEGEYVVTVVWHPVEQTKAGAVRGDNKLPVRYARGETSGLKLHVDKGTRELPPLELKK